MKHCKNNTFLTAVLLITVAGLLSYSCFSVNYSATGATPPGKTYSVQFVENQARLVEPGLSQLVTEQLKDYIRANSKLVLINGSADNDFEAVITGYEPSVPASIAAGDVATQNRFTITIKVRYTCNVNPELDFESSFSRFMLYSVDSDFETVKAELTEDILELMMEDIYKRAFVNW